MSIATFEGIGSITNSLRLFITVRTTLICLNQVGKQLFIQNQHIIF